MLEIHDHSFTNIFGERRERFNYYAQYLSKEFLYQNEERDICLRIAFRRIGEQIRRGYKLERLFVDRAYGSKVESIEKTTPPVTINYHIQAFDSHGVASVLNDHAETIERHLSRVRADDMSRMAIV